MEIRKGLRDGLIRIKTKAGLLIRRRRSGGDRAALAAKKAAVFLLALIVWVALVQYAAAEKYAAKVMVGKETAQASGSADASTLDFGIMREGETATRYVSVSNKGSYPVRVTLRLQGGIAKLLRSDESNFVLKPKESRQLEMALSVPQGAKSSYEGQIFIMKIPSLF